MHPFCSLQIGLGVTYMHRNQVPSLLQQLHLSTRPMKRREQSARHKQELWKKLSNQDMSREASLGQRVWVSISSMHLNATRYQSLRGCRNDSVVERCSVSLFVVLRPSPSARRLVHQCLLRVQPRIGTVWVPMRSAASRENIVLFLTYTTIK